MQIFSIYIPESVTDEISDYLDEIAKESISNAIQWYHEIVDTINSLDQSPKRCPKADEAIYHDFEIRHLISGNYRILFRIEDLRVEILHIKHTKMERLALV